MVIITYHKWKESKMSKKIKRVISSIVVFSVIVILLQQTAFAEEKIFLDLPIGLKIDESANIDSSLIMTLLEVEDSRCPSDVTCVWQGTVTAKIKLEKEGQNLGIYDIPMETIQDSEQIFEGHYIRLTNVEPYPVSSNPIKEENYSLTFFVSSAEVKNVLSPLKQYKDGVSFKDIKCRKSLQLTQKYDGTPACVKMNTYNDLIKRGWVSDIIIAVQSQDLSDNKDQSDFQPVIKTGTDALFCLGYCFKEFVITPEKIMYTQSGRDVNEITKEISFSKSDWNELVSLIDFQKFNSLPDNIGCPGCADAPIEWIEISNEDNTKKIQYEVVDDVPEIKQLILALHEIRGPIESTIESFEDCVAAGNPIMESYPRQCRTSDGKHFVEFIDSPPNLENNCTTFGGKWLPEFNECENISKDQCSEMMGVFKECESACRHDPDAEMCTMQCVLVCEIL
jgi:hypothetical protein